MKKINFVNGETIDGANTFNTMQDNVEDVFNGNEAMGSIVVEDITCKNKFNKNTITSGKGISTSTGDLYSQSSLFTTDYIDVTDSSDIAWNGTYTSGTKPWGAFYDSNKKYISGFETTLNVNTIAIPTGVAYVRLTYADNSNDFLNKLQIESGLVATNYVEHKEYANDFSNLLQCVYKKTIWGNVLTNTGINVNSGAGGRTYLVCWSTHSSTGNSTSSYIGMLRCGYNGNNYSLIEIARSTGSTSTLLVTFSIDATGNLQYQNSSSGGASRVYIYQLT